MGLGLDFDGILRIRLSQVKKKEITFVYSRRILIQAPKKLPSNLPEILVIS